VIDAPRLLTDLTRLLKRLEDDLRARIGDLLVLKASLQAEWQAARDADRTAETFDTWVDQIITQAGVHWLLSCVFLRFIEDNELVERPWLGGTPTSGRLALARDRHEGYFRAQPLHSDRDYLVAAFREAGALPGLHTFFDEAHNPVFRLGISGDAAMALRQYWQQVDPNTGVLVHDFTDGDWNTRFLGDLYQDLSEATRKRYALLQTPEFVEEFILDRTLTPAIREFGFREVRMIDPTCGSGHFLLGGFRRLVDEWTRHEPARNPRDIAQRALDAVAGVDLNPFAVAISRFRLLVAALKVSRVHRLSEAPNFKLNVAIGDSLLHGKRFGMTATDGMFEGAEHYVGTGLAHAYASEDLAEVQRILGRQYHAVVGNPPYIVVKDAALNAAYRKAYPASCHMKYSLGAPFTQRFFELAITGNGQPAGFVGLITANSFMKREFGSKLIEQVLPRLDLTHVVDTSGAYVPGHGTPTVILFGRHRAPVGDVVRTVMGIKGEPSTPDDPAHGLVWSAIVEQVDRAGSESEFISVGDTPRATFGKHPWSIGGGGAADLKEVIESDRPTVRSIADEVGITAVNGEDDLYLLADAAHAKRIGLEHTRPMVTGDLVRDWTAGSMTAVWLYDSDFNLLPLERLLRIARHFWPAYSVVSRRKRFGTPMVERGLTWYEYQELYVNKLRTPLTITFGEVATHNHFVLDRGGKVFNRTAPVIKLSADATEDDHLGLLGLLNSSVACFWLKQVCFPKGGDTLGGEGARVRKTLWDERYAINASNVAEFPLCAGRPLHIAAKLDARARDLGAVQPAALLASGSLATRASLDAARLQAAELRRLMIAHQEELDWQCYRLYGLLPAGMGADEVEHRAPVEVALGERAFEIVLARRMAAGPEDTTWFERHGSNPITEIPPHWPEAYRRVVERRIELIQTDKNIGLIERPEYKRRWNSPRWEDLEKAALRDWLLDHLEARVLWPANADVPPQISTTSRLADAVSRDAEFMQIAALFAGHEDFDLAQLVADLVKAESVPFLPVLRYTDTGLRKRLQWEDTWALQRREDAGEHVGNIPVPPKYQGKDFLKADFWRLRGGLDVAKERWVSYPGCERGADTSLPIAWAGWSHLQQATALASYYLEMKENEGWEAGRLQPLLAGLLELVPWLEQWHNEVDPVYSERMGAYYRSFVSEEARAHGFTLDDLRAWQPVAASSRRGRRTAR
jgi:hypothetical protein